MNASSLTTEVLTDIVGPALALLPERMDSVMARVMLLAIGLQESRFKYRRQIRGPARGFWQFEKGGGVQGVLTHPRSRNHAIDVCARRGVAPLRSSVYHALVDDDFLACAFARLLLWTDPAPLPPFGNSEAAWQVYLRNWRPGRPHRQTWNAFYADAIAAVAEAG